MSNNLLILVEYEVFFSRSEGVVIVGPWIISIPCCFSLIDTLHHRRSFSLPLLWVFALVSIESGECLSKEPPRGERLGEYQRPHLHMEYVTVKRASHTKAEHSQVPHERVSGII